MIYPDLKPYPYDQPPTPRKRCPLARGFANATRSLRGLLSVLRGVLYAGLPARNRGLPRAPLRVDRRPGQPPAATLWSVPRYGGAIARGAPKRRSCRSRPAFATALVLYSRGTPQPLPALPRPSVALVPCYLVLVLRWLSPCPAGG